jgi:3-dehydroquinate dehydratase-2
VRVDVLNGVNLDLLGRRDTDTYGHDSLQDLETRIYSWARELALNVRCRQTNHEGEYVGFLHAALDNADAIIVNPGAWTHYSWAIRDALEPFPGAIVEVHLSDVMRREEWRRHSVLEGLVTQRIVGKGFEGYREALQLLREDGDAA